MKVLLLIIMITAAPVSWACGTTEQQFERYWKLESNLEKQDWLAQLDCTGMVNYYPRRADPVILAVMSDAIERQLSREVLEGILDTYHCIHGERQSDGYEAIRGYLGERHNTLCPTEELASLYLVATESGANLRSGPSANTERVAGLLPGVQVRVLESGDDWHKVIVAEEVEGWIYAPLLSAY